MNLARLLQMSPAEAATRVQQAWAKRWARPPAPVLVTTSAPRVTLEPPPFCLIQAEKILRHRFDLLGYQDLDFGEPIDWHFDPVHGKRAPRKPWHQIPFLDFDQVGDHKVIWELNRHQHLVTLAQAWKETGDHRFRDEVLAQWAHWQRENPYPTGINWASSLEAAFRALSWLWLWQFIGDFDGLLASLHLHGWYIETFLSTYFSPNTHLLGEGVALFALGVLCPEIADAPRWKERGWDIVLQQARAQVRPDGLHFEQSVYYHLYALDFFRLAAAVSSSDALQPTIEKMTGAMALLSQAGALPDFGDDDGGRVMVSPARLPAPPAVQFVGGIYLMTSKDAQLFIDAGPQGALTAGHGHADALSIQLISQGRRILIDPGTYCYVCPERDRFRGTAAHNTVQIDGRNQATPSGPFAWTKLPKVTVDRWQPEGLFAAHHDGYGPVIHQRWVAGLKDGAWLVRDVVTGPGRHRIDIHWHFLDEGDIAIVPPVGHRWSRSIERWDWSPVYGRKDPAYVLRFSIETELPTEFAVMLDLNHPDTLTQTAPGAYRYGEREFTFDGGGFAL